MCNLSNLEQKLLKYNHKLVKKFKYKNKIPATSIGGIYSQKYNLSYCEKLVNPIAKQLNFELNKLGAIGHRSKLSVNPIGHCCEVHTANKLILNHPIKNTVKINKILFTNARRPRTNQFIKRCPNCKFIFGP